jgi:hypothetical protein
VNAMTNRIGGTIKRIAQHSSKPSESGLTVTSPSHPLERPLIITSKRQSGIELQNKLGGIVTLTSHKPYET